MTTVDKSHLSSELFLFVTWLPEDAGMVSMMPRDSWFDLQRDIQDVGDNLLAMRLDDWMVLICWPAGYSHENVDFEIIEYMLKQYLRMTCGVYINEQNRLKFFSK